MKDQVTIQYQAPSSSEWKKFEDYNDDYWWGAALRDLKKYGGEINYTFRAVEYYKGTVQYDQRLESHLKKYNMS